MKLIHYWIKFCRKNIKTLHIEENIILSIGKQQVYVRTELYHTAKIWEEAYFWDQLLKFTVTAIWTEVWEMWGVVVQQHRSALVHYTCITLQRLCLEIKLLQQSQEVSHDEPPIKSHIKMICSHSECLCSNCRGLTIWNTRSKTGKKFVCFMDYNLIY